VAPSGAGERRAAKELQAEIATLRAQVELDNAIRLQNQTSDAVRIDRLEGELRVARKERAEAETKLESIVADAVRTRRALMEAEKKLAEAAAVAEVVDTEPIPGSALSPALPAERGVEELEALLTTARQSLLDGSLFTSKEVQAGPGLGGGDGQEPEVQGEGNADPDDQDTTDATSEGVGEDLFREALDLDRNVGCFDAAAEGASGQVALPRSALLLCRALLQGPRNFFQCEERDEDLRLAVHLLRGLRLDAGARTGQKRAEKAWRTKQLYAVSTLGAFLGVAVEAEAETAGVDVGGASPEAGWFMAQVRREYSKALLAAVRSSTTALDAALGAEILEEGGRSVDGIHSEGARARAVTMGRATEPRIARVLEVLQELLDACNSQRTAGSVIRQLFRQVFHGVDARLFNALLQRGELCTYGNGIAIKLGLSRLREWARGAGVGGEAEEQLAHIAQAADVLCVPKEVLLEADVRERVCPGLTLHQLKYLVLTLWTPDEFMPDPISDEAIFGFRALDAGPFAPLELDEYPLREDAIVPAACLGLAEGGLGLPQAWRATASVPVRGRGR